MLKQVKFSKLKVNAGFGIILNSELMVKTSRKSAENTRRIMSYVHPDTRVWADDSQIKPWWKLW